MRRTSEFRQIKLFLIHGSLSFQSVQIAIRLPEGDIAKAREIAERKGIGYQTLLKMYVREGLLREAGGR